jgi:Alpha/beta hydrolase family
MASSQRPAGVATLNQPSGTPAWDDIPTWYVVAAQDRTIPPATQRFMAERAQATTIELRSSHVAMMSRPRQVSNVIIDAAESIGSRHATRARTSVAWYHGRRQQVGIAAETRSPARTEPREGEVLAGYSCHVVAPALVRVVPSYRTAIRPARDRFSMRTRRTPTRRSALPPDRTLKLYPRHGPRQSCRSAWCG